MNPRISASLILCRECINNSFEVMMIKRKQGLSFSEAFVFPGGSSEDADATPFWSQTLGCSSELIPETNFAASVDLTKLRITAIRET